MIANPCSLSIVTQKYITCYDKILNRMISGMTTASLNHSISHNFIVQMLPHHRAAIEMSKNLLCYTTFIPLQDIALNIIEEQTKSIQNMQKVLCCCSRHQNTHRHLLQYQEQIFGITQLMFSDMLNAPVENDINVSFLHEMLPHHKGAIQMSKTALDFPICPQLVPILEAIITSQETGVRQMEELLSMHCEGMS